MKITKKISVLLNALKKIADAGLMSTEWYFKGEGFGKKEINNLINETTEDKPQLCPRCGSNNIKWGRKNMVNNMRTSKCKRCGWGFSETY